MHFPSLILKHCLLIRSLQSQAFPEVTSSIVDFLNNFKDLISTSPLSTHHLGNNQEMKTLGSPTTQFDKLLL